MAQKTLNGVAGGYLVVNFEIWQELIYFSLYKHACLSLALFRLFAI
jgi:hypothetical protein